MVGRTVHETEKKTTVTMSWFRGAPRVDVIDGTGGHLLDEHVYVCRVLSPFVQDLKMICNGFSQN